MRDSGPFHPFLSNQSIKQNPESPHYRRYRSVFSRFAYIHRSPLTSRWPVRSSIKSPFRSGRVRDLSASRSTDLGISSYRHCGQPHLFLSIFLSSFLSNHTSIPLPHAEATSWLSVNGSAAKEGHPSNLGCGWMRGSEWSLRDCP